MLSLSTAPARIASRDTFALTQVPSAVTTPAVMGTQRRHVSRRQVTPVCMGRKAAKVAKKKAGSIVKGCVPSLACVFLWSLLCRIRDFSTAFRGSDRVVFFIHLFIMKYPLSLLCVR